MRLAVVLILVLLSVVFAVQNADVVALSLFFWRLDVSLAVIIALCLGVGALVAGIALAPELYRRRSDQRKLQRRIAELDPDSGPATDTGAAGARPPVAPLHSTPPQPRS